MKWLKICIKQAWANQINCAKFCIICLLRLFIIGGDRNLGSHHLNDRNTFFCQAIVI